MQTYDAFVFVLFLFGILAMFIGFWALFHQEEGTGHIYKDKHRAQRDAEKRRAEGLRNPWHLTSDTPAALRRRAYEEQKKAL